VVIRELLYGASLRSARWRFESSSLEIKLEFAHRSVRASGPQHEQSRFSIVVQVQAEGSANRWGARCLMTPGRTFARALFKDMVWFALTLPIVMQQSTVLLALTNFHASPVCFKNRDTHIPLPSLHRDFFCFPITHSTHTYSP